MFALQSSRTQATPLDWHDRLSQLSRLRTLKRVGELDNHGEGRMRVVRDSLLVWLVVCAGNNRDLVRRDGLGGCSWNVQGTRHGKKSELKKRSACVDNNACAGQT